MEKNANVMMESLKVTLVQLIQEATKDIPIGGVYYVFKDVYSQLTNEYNNYIQETIRAQQEEAEKETAPAENAEEVEKEDNEE